MKEYIDKQSLKREVGFISAALPCGIDATERALNRWIDNKTTVTQVELESLAYNRGARAFAEKLKEKIVGISPLYATDEYDYCKAELLEQVDGKIDELLKEMGCE